MSADVLLWVAGGYVALVSALIWRIAYLAPGAYRNVQKEDGTYPE